VPDHVELVGLERRGPADVHEEKDLEDRRDEHRRDVDLGPEEREERAEADQPAEREDPERRHASESDPALRALRRTFSSTATPMTTYRPPSANAAAISGPGAPPEAASRIASTPQVGASTHEIGCTQSGSSVIGTRKPATSQTGYSRRFPSA